MHVHVSEVFAIFDRVATGQGKVWEIWFFFSVREKSEFCKLVREILNTKKVRELQNFGPKYVL